jgi:hypothetical protein
MYFIGFPRNDRGVELITQSNGKKRKFDSPHKISKPEVAKASPHLISQHNITEDR